MMKTTRKIYFSEQTEKFRRGVPLKEGKGRGILLWSLILILILLTAVQVTLSARVATAGRRIRELELRKQELILGNQKIENEIQKNSAISAISAKAQTLGLIPFPKSILYLSPRELFAQKTP